MWTPAAKQVAREQFSKVSRLMRLISQKECMVEKETSRIVRVQSSHATADEFCLACIRMQKDVFRFV